VLNALLLGLAAVFFQSGGADAEPVFGRLGSVEPIAKPTERSVSVYGATGVGMNQCMVN